MLLSQKPTDYGIDRNIWTGKILSSVIELRTRSQVANNSNIWNIVTIKFIAPESTSRLWECWWRAAKAFYIYLKKNSKLSRQRKELYFLMNLRSTTAQVCFMNGLKKILVLRFQAMKKDAEINGNGMLAVDAVTGEEYFKLK